MTPEEQAAFYKLIKRMDKSEARRRQKNLEFLIGRFKVHADKMRDYLAHPEKVQEDLDHDVKRIAEFEVQVKIYYIHLKGLLDG